MFNNIVFHNIFKFWEEMMNNSCFIKINLEDSLVTELHMVMVTELQHWGLQGSVKKNSVEISIKCK